MLWCLLFLMLNIQLLLCLLLSIAGLCVADPETVYGNKGLSYTFICPYKKISADNVVWDYVVNTSTTFTISDGEGIANSPLKDRVSIVGNHTAGEYSLELRKLQESDEVVYRCSVRLQLKEYKFELLAPPSILALQNETDNKIRGTEGQSLTLRCTATGGKPPPLVTITVDNVVRLAYQTVAYTIPTLHRQHDGQIVQCNANSSALTFSLVAIAALDLNIKPLQPIFSQDPISTEETKPLVVSCTSNGSRPAATFQWTIGWMNVTSNSTSQSTVNTADNTYTVTSTLRYNVDRTYNRQTIACTAVNVAAYDVNTSRILDVKFAPDIYVTDVTYSQNNPTRTVTCNIIGNPTTYTYYKWQHKSRYGVLIRELDGGQILTLPSVPVEAIYQDSGEYVCTASNGITGRDGKINQTGSGYVTVNAQPTFTNGNKYTEYVDFGSNVDIHVHVYSFPKYTSVIWYKSFMQISQTDKYTLSESKAIVNDTFYGTLIQLDGYRVTLTIKNSEESDVNVSYRVEMFNGVGQPVKQTTLLLSVSAPQTPINFTVLRSSASSIVVQWEAGYNGGYEQTFYLQFRRFGSSSWVAMKIPVTEQTGIQTFTVSELQDGILFELMMYAENMFKRSLPTETKTIATIKDSRFSSTEVEKWGIAGGLSAVIIIMFIIIITLVILRKKGTNRRKSKGQYSRWNEKTAYSMPMDGKESEGNADLVEIDKHNKTIIASAKEYETLGLKDNPNTYSEILTQQGQKQSETSTQEYETLGMVDYPNTYSELNRQPAQSSSEYTNIKI